MNLVLLGDSILDNASYTRPHPDTATHLGRLLGRAWNVVLLARDGATMSGVPAQLQRLPADTSLTVLSVGGNDVLRHAGVLQRRATSAADVLDELATITEQFSSSYGALLDMVSRLASRLIVCTIYEAPIINPAIARLATVPLSLLNDRIVRAASARDIDVLDLRTVCTTPADFTMEIEPSAAGAERIARAIAGIVAPGPGVHAAKVQSMTMEQGT